MAETVILRGLVVGEFGKAFVLTCVDDDGDVQNISAYTGTKALYMRPPNSGEKKVSVTLSFVTDGTDGKLTGSFAANDLSRAGDWDAQVELRIGTSAVAKSIPFIASVAGAI